MISKELMRKLEMQNEVMQTRRRRKKRRKFVRASHTSDTDNSDSIGDFKIIRRVIEQKLSTDDFKKRICSDSKSLMSSCSKNSNDGFLSTSKFADDKTRGNAEVDAFRLFMPNVFKHKGKSSTVSESSAPKSKPTSTTYEQLGLSKKSVEKRVTRLRHNVEKKHGDGSSKKSKSEASPKDESALSKLVGIIAPSVQGGNKPWMQFCRNAQKALAVLNDEVSTALRDSFCSIDDIQMRIRKTMDEIRECDKMYEHLRLRQQWNSSHSVPYIKKVDVAAKEEEKVFKPLGTVIIQSHSENQVRVAPLPSIEESIYETEIEHNDSATIVEDDAVPKHVSSTSSTKTTCDNPPELPLDTESEELIVPTPTPITDARAESVGGSETDLRRKKGQWNLHDEVVEECTKKKVVVSRPKPMVQIVAEELFVPEKINRIASTNLNNGNTDTKIKKKACQFLYKTKKPQKQNETASLKVQAKYADSVLFAKRDRKASDQSCNLIIENFTQNGSKLKQEFKSLTVQSVNCKTGLDCFDILDEITLNDLKPLQSEYPRKDADSIPNQVQNTYLYKLIYGPMQDEFLKLLRFEEPSLQCAENCEKCARIELSEIRRTPSSSSCKPHSRKLYKKDNTSEMALGKGATPKQKRSKKNAHDDIVSRLKPYMFDPHMRYPTTITVMPAMITTYTNPNFVKNANKALAERNQVGDCTPTRYTSKLNKTIRSLNRSSSNIEKKKGCTNKPVRVTNVARPRFAHEKMHGDAWDDYETPTTIPSNQKIIKRRTFRSHYESIPKSIPKQVNDTNKFRQQRIQKQNKWEANIQSVIEMIEAKIVEILSDPEKTHLEAFKSVETKILEILNSEKSLDVIEEGSQIDIQTDKLLLRKNFRSKTVENLRKYREKSDLRSKTDLSLVKHFPLECYNKVDISQMMSTTKFGLEEKVNETTSTNLNMNTSTAMASSELLQFLDSITTMVTEDVPRYYIKKMFYCRPWKIPRYILAPQVYYIMTRYETSKKSVVEHKPQTPPKQEVISKPNVINPKISCLTASTRTYKVLTVNRRPSAMKKPPIPRPKVQQQKKPIKFVPKSDENYPHADDVILYSKLLNYVYATLFAIVFFGLTFNYTCQ